MRESFRLFLCGDVMTGRGIDPVLPHPSEPALHESYLQDAGRYVDLAEEVHGAIPAPVAGSYIWGDALSILDRIRPDARIINLETAITTSENWEEKGINYRMHPGNIEALTSAKIDCCVLANNHVLDWGEAGLRETLETLHQSGIRTSGAGLSFGEANAPAVIEIPGKGRVLVFSFGMESSGISPAWAASASRPGISFVAGLSPRKVSQVASQVQSIRRQGDIVTASLHWGPNWGYDIDSDERRFAHALIDEAGVDLVHGHSSHHVKGIEIYREKLILYGCGDLITDYEGIGGHEEFRGDLSLLYFPEIEPDTGKLISLEMIPVKMHRFRLQGADATESRWLFELLRRESRSDARELELAFNPNRLILAKPKP